jgi:hypothetical protein
VQFVEHMVLLDDFGNLWLPVAHQATLRRPRQLGHYFETQLIAKFPPSIGLGGTIAR